MTVGGGVLPEVIVIFGPTASGKTGAAVAVAEALGGEVINADSRQIYERIPIIAATPGEAERKGIPHHLFEFIDPAERMSAARWAGLALQEIEAVVARGKVPVVVGGTGLYLRVLMEGISEIPEVPIDVELEYRGRAAPELHAELSEVDPVLAAKLHPSDTQRIVRALAVYTHTGTPLSQWQAAPGMVPPYAFKKLAIALPREVLYERIETRWGAMVAQGMVEEIKALHEAGYTLDMPGLQGLGITEVYDFLEGRLSWNEASRVAVQGTRHYAKRQMTWLRNTFKADHEFETAEALVAHVVGA